MKKLHLGHLICGVFTGLGFGLFLAVLIEWLVNDYEPAAWVQTAKVLGIIALCLACVSLLLVVLLEAKKVNKEEKQNNDQELLEKYKSVKKK